MTQTIFLLNVPFGYWTKYGPYTFDRFADTQNSKVPKFHSKFCCPNTSGVDAFTEHWGGENNWISDPVSLIGAVFRHMKLCQATGTIFVPLWESAYFWPLLYPNGCHLAGFVHDFTVIDPYYTSSGGNKVFVGRPKFRTLASYCKFWCTGAVWTRCQVHHSRCLRSVSGLNTVPGSLSAFLKRVKSEPDAKAHIRCPWRGSSLNPCCHLGRSSPTIATDYRQVLGFIEFIYNF